MSTYTRKDRLLSTLILTEVWIVDCRFRNDKISVVPLGVHVLLLSLSAVARELNFRSAQRGAVGRRVVRWRGGERRAASNEWGEPGFVLELGWGAARAGSCWRARAGAARAPASWRRGKCFLGRRYVESRTFRPPSPNWRMVLMEQSEDGQPWRRSDEELWWPCANRPRE